MHPLRPTPALPPVVRLVALPALLLLALCLTAFEPPPPDGRGSGTIAVQVRDLSGMPVTGLSVQFLDEWHFQPYAACTTDLTGACLLTIESAPAVGETVRGVVDVGAGRGVSRYQDAMFLSGDHITVVLTLSEQGELVRGADVLATRDPHLTPTLISPESAFATLTAAALEPLATPSPGIVLTVVEAHARMTGTAVARTTLTPPVAPTGTATPRVGVAVIVNASPVPTGAAAGASEPTDATATPEASVPTLLQLVAGGIVVVVVGAGVVLWLEHRRARAGGTP
jgi:hypothetical protein